LQLIWFLHGAILTLFSVYPVVWAVTVELNWVPLPTEMWLFANMDITTKLILTSVLSNLTAAAYDYDYGTPPLFMCSGFSPMNFSVAAHLLTTACHCPCPNTPLSPSVSVDLPGYFKELISAMGVPAFAINKQGAIAHWNRAMETITNVRMAVDLKDIH
jgi:PAS domain-containing protein